jgi:hypothetical protein
MSRDQWWVDFLENEVEPGLKLDLEKLLAKSGKDRAALDALANLRRWIADSDPVNDLWSNEKMRALAKKIDQAVEALPAHGSAEATAAEDRRKPSTRSQASGSSPDFSGKRQEL